MHDLQLTQFDGHSADVSLEISGMTIKLSQLKIVHNTDLKMNGLYILNLKSSRIDILAVQDEST